MKRKLLRIGCVYCVVSSVLIGCGSAQSLLESTEQPKTETIAENQACSIADEGKTEEGSSEELTESGSGSDTDGYISDAFDETSTNLEICLTDADSRVFDFRPYLEDGAEFLHYQREFAATGDPQYTWYFYINPDATIDVIINMSDKLFWDERANDYPVVAMKKNVIVKEKETIISDYESDGGYNNHFSEDNTWWSFDSNNETTILYYEDALNLQ